MKTQRHQTRRHQTRNLRALILVGGRGTRLRSVVSDVPKPLAEVAGKPFIVHLFEYLAEYGISDIVLLTGYKGELVRERLGDGSDFGVQLRYSQEPEALGTGGALRHALPLIGEGPVLALNGDSLVRANLAEFLDFHQARREADPAAKASLVLSRVENKARYGTVERDSDDAITAFREKDENVGASGPGWVNGGIYLLEREVVAGMTAGDRISLERTVFSQLVGNGIYGCRSSAGLMDIGTPTSFARAQGHFADG